MAGGLNETGARGFSKAADVYQRARPSYPTEAVDWIIQHMRLDEAEAIVDLAAGTGIFTRELVARGLRVTAVEPVEAMRARCAASLPDVPVLDGTAEHMPFADASLDAITVAQAFHWFATDIALDEIARVLEPNGMLGLVWNARDDSVDWVARTTEIFARYEPKEGVRVPRHRERAWRAAMDKRTDFAAVAEREFPNTQTLTPQGLVERIASVSFVAVLPDDERQRALDDVRALIETHPDLKGRPHFEHPYITEVYLFRKLDPSV